MENLNACSRSSGQLNKTSHSPVRCVNGEEEPRVYNEFNESRELELGLWRLIDARGNNSTVKNNNSQKQKAEFIDKIISLKGPFGSSFGAFDNSTWYSSADGVCTVGTVDVHWLKCF